MRHVPLYDKNGYDIITGDYAKGETRKGKELNGKIIAVSQTHPKVLLHDLHTCVTMWLHPSKVEVRVPDYRKLRSRRFYD